MFLLALGGIVGFAVIFNALRGIKAHYIETFTPAPGEVILLDDAAADFYLVPRYGRALFMSYGRLGRTRALLTNHRLVVGQRVLFGQRHMLTHLVYLRSETVPPAELDMLGGGQFSVGYQVLLVEAGGLSAAMDGKKPYLAMTPADTTSAMNISQLRLYSDQTDALLRLARQGDV